MATRWKVTTLCARSCEWASSTQQRLVCISPVRHRYGSHFTQHALPMSTKFLFASCSLPFRNPRHLSVYRQILWEATTGEQYSRCTRGHHSPGSGLVSAYSVKAGHDFESELFHCQFTGVRDRNHAGITITSVVSMQLMTRERLDRQYGPAVPHLPA